MKILSGIGLLLVIFSFGCTSEGDRELDGKKPIYISYENYTDIKSEPVKPFTVVGKIFTIGNRIFISDKGTGVHIINNTSPSSPTKETFISIVGNNDMAVKDNIMYADNGNDLVAINISDITNAQLEKRLENVYQFNSSQFPIDHFGYFECVDTEKGIAVDWIDAKLLNPKCER